MNESRTLSQFADPRLAPMVACLVPHVGGTRA